MAILNIKELFDETSFDSSSREMNRERNSAIHRENLNFYI